MMYADTASGRAEASPGLKGTCPSCGHPCRPKCGKIIVHHWAHHARADCDPWAEPMTEWHLGWQRAVPPERREVVMGPHRADIVTASGGVVEIQHSPISVDVITEREEFYGDRMAWIFDATGADILVSALAPVLANTPCGCANEQCSEIWLRPGTACRCGHPGCAGYMRERQWSASPDVQFRWKRARASLAACRRPVFLDLGDGTVLRIGSWPPFVPAIGMTGTLYTRASVEGWLRDGTQLERMILPSSSVLPSGYDPPHMERKRTPAVWMADQEQRRVRNAAAIADRIARRLAIFKEAAAEPQVVTTDDKWLAAALRIVPDVGPEACQALLDKVIEKYRKGELAKADLVKVLNLLKTRIEALKSTPPAAVRVIRRPGR
jgi:hypothetical protein